MNKTELRKLVKQWERAAEIISAAKDAICNREAEWDRLPKTIAWWQDLVDGTKPSQYLSPTECAEALQSRKDELADGRDAYLTRQREHLANANDEYEFLGKSLAVQTILYLLGKKAHNLEYDGVYTDATLDTKCVLDGVQMTVLDAVAIAVAKQERKVKEVERTVPHKLDGGVCYTLGESVQRAVRGLKPSDLVSILGCTVPVSKLRSIAGLYPKRWDITTAEPDDAMREFLNVLRAQVDRAMGVPLQDRNSTIPSLTIYLNDGAVRSTIILRSYPEYPYASEQWKQDNAPIVLIPPEVG